MQPGGMEGARKPQEAAPVGVAVSAVRSALDAACAVLGAILAIYYAKYAGDVTLPIPSPYGLCADSSLMSLGESLPHRGFRGSHLARSAFAFAFTAWTIIRTVAPRIG